MLYKREDYLSKIRSFYNETDLIKVITGVRRCGKSTLMQLIIEELLNHGIAKENIFLINLEKTEFRKVRTVENLESTINKLSLSSTEGIKYLFIDEVQYIKSFEEYINSLRADGDWSIFLTGSNSYLLSSEIGTILTGRYIPFEVFPLSFKEYEEMKALYGKTINPNPLIEIDSYIRNGGFPRSVLFDDDIARRTYVESIVSEIFEKDIKQRVKIKNTDTFDSVINFIIGNFGSEISINSIQKEFKKRDISISRETLSRYIKALCDAKIIYECKRFDTKSKKILSGEKKYYLADTSFYYARNTDAKVNFGPSLENIVFLYAKSKNYSISVGKVGNFECDFILRATDSSYSYVQVAYTILASSETEEREYRVLEKIKDNWPKYVVTTDYSLIKRNGIQHINIINFMLENKSF